MIMLGFDLSGPDSDLTGFYCSRCGVGGWHPEARACQFKDCGLSAVGEAPLIADGVSGAGADLPSLASAPVFPGDVDSHFHVPEDAR